MKNFLFCSLIILSFSCKKTPVNNGDDNSNNPAVVFESYISPSTANPLVTTFNSQHYILVDTVMLKNKLFVFLPGTTGSPQFYKLIVKKAASLGYHAIGLMYPNNSDLYTASAASTDNTQFGKCRQEIFDGTDQTNGVNVNNANCIQTRLRDLLIYLNTNDSIHNWSQFLSNNEIDWSKIIIAGHSQGGGHALYISKQVRVGKAISFSSIDWNATLGRSADWVTIPGATPNSKLYSFNGINDEIFSYTNVQTQLLEMGLTGPAVSIDSNQPPYLNSHTITTNATPATSVLFPDHNITCLDAYVPKNSSNEVSVNFDNAWEYLLNQ